MFTPLKGIIPELNSNCLYSLQEIFSIDRFVIVIFIYKMCVYLMLNPSDEIVMSLNHYNFTQARLARYLHI